MARRWKFLVAAIVFAALTALFQFFVLPPQIRTSVIPSEEERALGSSFNASIASAGSDAVEEMVLVDNLASHKRLSMRTESSSVNALSGTGEMYIDGFGNGTVNPTLLRSESMKIEKFVRRMRGETVTFSEMNSMIIRAQTTSGSLQRRRLSARDRELLAAKKHIKAARARSSESRPILGLHAPLFRNFSMFQRSYELMEQTLKIYIYKEGERPLFHQPRLRGIYCSEGWFMKLLERNRRFVVRDPKKAHLFYLPFSSEMLRVTLYQGKKSSSLKTLEMYLSSYMYSIKRKYNFWNRTGGADHFFVGCHDWAPRITKDMSSCIRAVCNANIARGFDIGKDVSVPVTYIRSGNNPLQDIGGNQPSERPILAFFAGGMHGYLRPLLLQHWENKSPDMKILGPMQRDIEGKAAYRGYMKQSKYCICARGYGVHTPRVVESIYYECVPVIISDNYVPPLFEVLDWEVFSVFVAEKDIPYLREILVSISEERYVEMQRRVKMVQRHFAWNKMPEKYDLFHMILHSIWYSRVSQAS